MGARFSLSAAEALRCAVDGWAILPDSTAGATMIAAHHPGPWWQQAALRRRPVPGPGSLGLRAAQGGDPRMVTDGPARARLPVPRPALPAAVVLPLHRHLAYRTPLTPPADGFAQVRAVRGNTVVELHGEIDITTVHVVTTHLDAATAGQRPRVLVDLSVVTFIDCAGLEPICRARHRTLARGGCPALVCSDPRTLPILRMTGLIPAVSVVPRAENAPQPEGLTFMETAYPRTGRNRSRNLAPAPLTETRCWPRCRGYAACQVLHAPRSPRSGGRADCCASGAAPLPHQDRTASRPGPRSTCCPALDRTANRGATPIPQSLNACHRESTDRHDAHRREFRNHHLKHRPCVRPVAVIRDVR